MSEDKNRLIDAKLKSEDTKRGLENMKMRALSDDDMELVAGGVGRCLRCGSTSRCKCGEMLKIM